MKLELDYKKGDKVLVLIDGKFTVETITGQASLSTDEDGNPVYVTYTIDRPDPVYTSTNMSISSLNIFRTLDDALKHTGLADINPADFGHKTPADFGSKAPDYFSN